MYCAHKFAKGLSPAHKRYIQRFGNAIDPLNSEFALGETLIWIWALPVVSPCQSSGNIAELYAAENFIVFLLGAHISHLRLQITI